jgi:hypothetical protein
MGEATFYLLAKFESIEDAKFAEDFARIVLEELSNFQDEWQKIRKNEQISPIERHKILLKKFPLVKKYIRLPKPPKEDLPMNYLAGACEITNHFDLYSQGKLVKLSDYVWHLASWNNISEFFYRLGARKVIWESDEYVDIFELLEERLRRPEVKKNIRKFSKEKIKKILIAHKIGRKENEK